MNNPYRRYECYTNERLLCSTPVSSSVLGVGWSSNQNLRIRDYSGTD
jgi:hypothetical protein